MNRISVIPLLNGFPVEKIAPSFVDSTLPTTAGVIAHGVHLAIYNLKRVNLDQYSPGVSFLVTFEENINAENDKQHPKRS